MIYKFKIVVMLITVIYTIIFLNHHLPFFSLKCGIMIKKDIKMEDIKKFLWIIFLITLAIFVMANIEEMYIQLISFIVLFPFYIWLDYKLNPHKYKKDS